MLNWEYCWGEGQGGLSLEKGWKSHQKHPHTEGKILIEIKLETKISKGYKNYIVKSMQIQQKIYFILKELHKNTLKFRY